MKRDWTLARAKVESEGRCRLADAHCSGPLAAAHVTGRAHDAEATVQPCDIVPLCTEHHGAYDSRRVSILEVLTLEEQAAAVQKLGLIRALRRLTSGSTEPVERPF